MWALPQGLFLSQKSPAGGGRAPGGDLGVIFRAKWPKVTEGLSNIDISELIPGSRGFPRIPWFGADPVDPPDPSHEARLGTTLPHAPGVRMT